MADLDAFISGLPKAELHMHIEGSLEPELMFALARRNRVEIPFASVEEVQAAYSFSNLQDFLDIYYQGAAVLRTEEDFRDLAVAYFDRAAADAVTHAEIFFDPQTHTARGIEIGTVIRGLAAACERGERDVDDAGQNREQGDDGVHDEGGARRPRRLRAGIAAKLPVLRSEHQSMVHSDLLLESIIVGRMAMPVQ